MSLDFECHHDIEEIREFSDKIGSILFILDSLILKSRVYVISLGLMVTQSDCNTENMDKVQVLLYRSYRELQV